MGGVMSGLLGLRRRSPSSTGNWSRWLLNGDWRSCCKSTLSWAYGVSFYITSPEGVKHGANAYARPPRQG